MKQILEIFTDSFEDNIYSTLTIKPDKVTFLVDQDNADLCRRFPYTRSFLKSRIKDIEVEIYQCDFSHIFMIDDQLKEILKDVTYIDVTGGEDRVKIPLIQYAYENNIPCCYLDTKNENIVMINNNLNDPIEAIKFPDLDIEEILYLMGAAFYKGFYTYDPLYMPYVEEIIDLALKDIERWKRFNVYISYISSHYANKYGDVNAPLKIKISGKYYTCDMKFLKGLYKIGAIENLEFKNNEIYFNFYDENVEQMINQIGCILEVCAYIKLCHSHEFDEVYISTIIDWDLSDDDRISNEIDIIARKGRKMYFISCKCSELRAENLNEIVILTQRFGTKESTPVIITTQDINEETSLIYERAKKLGCLIIDIEDIKKGKLIEKLHVS